MSHVYTAGAYEARAVTACAGTWWGPGSTGR